MDDLDFSEAEICQELEKLGYKNLPFQRIKEFKRDLEKLVRQDRSNSSISTSNASNSFYSGDALSRIQLQDRSNLFLNKDSRVPSSQISADERGRLADNQINVSKSHSYNDRLNLERQRIPIHSTAKQISIPEVPLKSCLKNTEQSSHRDVGRKSDGDRLNFQSGNNWNYSPGDISSSTLADSSPRDQSTDTSHNDTQMSDRRQIKRKVLRKVDGRVEVNESVTEDDSSVDGRTEYFPPKNILLGNRPLSAPPAVSESHGHFLCREPSVYSLPDGYEGPKALIRPMSCDPHSKNIKKSDPVARYQQYRQSWDVCRAPGEKSHKQLRWGVREQMLYHDQVVVKKHQPVHQPNSYVIPSDKKRKNLRWQIRADLANGVKPPSMFD